MFGLFKKSDKPRVDAAEIERQEREQRKRDMAEKLKQDMHLREEASKKKANA